MAPEPTTDAPEGAKATYVLQEREGELPVWTDIATVTVPKRARPRRALMDGLALAGIEPRQAEGGHFRLLDEDNAAVLTLGVRQPRDPEYEVKRVG
jgi:hypothetical protein